VAKYCPYCGSELNSRSLFCPHCGKKSPARNLEQAGSGVERGRSRPLVSVPEPDEAAIPVTAESSPISATASSSASPGSSSPGRVTERRQSKAVTTRVAGVRARLYAPPTHVMIGALEQAGFGLRYGALMFDFLISLIAMMGFTFLVTAVSKHSVVGSNQDLVMVAGLTVLLFLLNFVALAGLSGQSAGMRILGIRIVRVDGTPFKAKHAVLRHVIGYPLSSAVFFLGFLWMLWDPRQQGWHDKLARTMVIVSK
jgi:uncharacterized RDD family membrane protein YckC